jgi:outer membrane protein assembly factor BamB
MKLSGRSERAGRFPLSSLLCLAFAQQPAQPLWGAFRGNHGCGLSDETGLPASLDPEHGLKWRVAVPAGYSSPVVTGKDVFLTGALANAQGKKVSGQLVTLCLDAATGATRWHHELEFSGAQPGNGSCAAPTPATDGRTVVALFHHFGMVAYDTTGKELWRRPLGPFVIPHGMASSPILEDGLVVVQADQNEGSYLAAFDAATGVQRWRVERAEFSHSYATPAIHRPAEGPAQVIVSGALQIASYALGSGEKLWWFAGTCRQTKGVPVLAGGRCYVKAFLRPANEMHMGGLDLDFAALLAEHDHDQDHKLSRDEFGQPRMHELWSDLDQDGDELLDAAEWELAMHSPRGGLFALDPAGKGDVTSSHLTWRVDDRRCLSGVTTPVIVGSTMFLLGEGGLLTSLDVGDGKIVKQERVGTPDQYFASPVAGEGRLYLASQGGLLTVVSAVPDWEVLATHALEEAEIWATPALAGKAVFVRSKEALYCFADP